MIVDDNPADVRLMRENLLLAASSIPALSGKLGFDIYEQDSIEGAITDLRAHPCDVILLDLGLPPHGGTESVREIRKAFPLLSLIVVSGDEDDTIALEAIHDGADDYLMKNELSPKRIIRAVRYAIERAKKNHSTSLYDTANIERLTELVRRLHE
jgi:DNA-binding NarL/FixJ family response regulator